MLTRPLTILGLILLAAPALSAGQEPSLGDAARKLREHKKAAPKLKVFTNDDVSPTGAARGVAPTAQGAGTASPSTDKSKKDDEEKKDEKGEAYWRKRFADARAKLRQAQLELDVLQREHNVLLTQYYPDPNKALNEQLRRTEINEHRQKVEDKQRQVAQLKQVIADLEDELRRAGGPSAWGRE